MASKKRLIYLLIGIMVLLLLGLEFFVPGLVASTLEGYLREEADSVESLTIKIDSFPAVKMLTGRIDEVDIEAEGLMIDNLYLNNLVLGYQDILLKQGGFTGSNTRLEIVIMEESLNNYIRAKYPDLEAFQLEITPENVLLKGNINIFEMIFNIQLSGNFIINDQKDIYFIPDNFQIEDLNIPVNLLKSYIEGLDFSFNLKDLNIPLDINEIKLYSGYTILRGGE